MTSGRLGRLLDAWRARRSGRAETRRERRLRDARAREQLAQTRGRQPYQNHGPGGH